MNDGSNYITFDYLRNATEDQVKELSVESICLLRDDLSERANAIEADEALMRHIMAVKFSGIAEVGYKGAGKDTGKVKIAISETHELVCERGKTVVWDQDKLAVLYSKIGQAGESADVYIKRDVKTSYGVGEAVYNGWPAEIKAAFEPARTVKAGEIKMSIQPKTKEKAK